MAAFGHEAREQDREDNRVGADQCPDAVDAGQTARPGRRAADTLTSRSRRRGGVGVAPRALSVFLREDLPYGTSYPSGSAVRLIQHRDRFDPVPGTQLPQDVFHVLFDGSFGDHQLCGDPALLMPWP